jgi:hypothetical protein
VVFGSAGISSAQRLGVGQYRFFFTSPKSNYVLTGSSTTNVSSYNTWICYVKKAVTYVDVSTCDTLPNLTYIDTANIDVLINEF